MNFLGKKKPLFYWIEVRLIQNIKMRRILKYKYYNARDVRPKCYRLKILQSKKQKWKFFIKKQSWVIKKLLRKAKWVRKHKIKKKITYSRRRKKLVSIRFRRKTWHKRGKIKSYQKTFVKTCRWLKLKKTNAAFIFQRTFYIHYEKFFGQRYLKTEIQDRKNKNKSISVKSFLIKPLFNYSILLFRAGLVSTVHESISRFRAGHILENAKKVKHSRTLSFGSFCGTLFVKTKVAAFSFKSLRKKYNKKLLLLLFSEIDYYTKSFVVVKNLSDLKNKECSLLAN